MDNLIELLYVSRYDYKPDWYLQPHMHDFFQLFLIIDGVGTAQIGTENVSVGENSVLMIPPGLIHALKADQGVRLMTLNTKFSIYDKRMVKDLCRLPTQFVYPSTRVRQLLEKIRVEGMKGDPWYRQLCNALMLECLIILLRESGTQEENVSAPDEYEIKDELVHKIVEYINSNYHKHLTLQDISDYGCYSPEYLSRRFHRSLGMTIHHYLMHVRIQKAREYLKFSDKTIKEITFLTGFKSIHHFSRSFKKQVGSTPAEWRDIEQEGIWKHILINPDFNNTDPTRRSEKN